jgi:single-strand DNA-binding protein
MAGDTQITVVGNLTGDPELRFIQSGAAVVNFTVASTPRTFDRQSNDWKDGDTLFMRCSLWREAAENVAESLTKGMRVVVTGRLVSRSWEANGEKRTVMEMQVDEVGPSLRYATAKVTRTPRTGGQGGGGGFSGGGQGGGGFSGGGQGGGSASAPAGGAANDPWASAPASDEPPF